MRLEWGGGEGLLVRRAEAGCENHKTRLRPRISGELEGGSHGGKTSALYRDPSGGVRGVRLLQSFQQEEAEASAGPRGVLHRWARPGQEVSARHSPTPSPPDEALREPLSASPPELCLGPLGSHLCP